MKMISALTKANIKNTGIELAPEHDFTDDGNRFRGFIYKGMVMTQCHADGTCFLSIRVDYQDNQFTWNEWSKTEEYKLEDKFNGVSSFDLDELIENLEKIIAKVNEMNENASKEEIDTSKIEAILFHEITAREKFIETVKTSLKWWELNEYDLKSARRYLGSLMNELDNTKKIDFNKLDRRTKKTYVERLTDRGYVALHKDYYVEFLEKCMK